MIKKCTSILMLLLLCLTMALPVFAAKTGSRLVDNADYLTDAEEAVLRNQLDEISARQEMDVVVVTIPALYGEDITAFADDYYDENSYREDGILLLISDFDRQWAISTAGAAIPAFTDAGQEYLVSQFIDSLSDGQYSAAFETYAELCDEFLSQAKSGTPYDRGALPKEPFHAISSLLISFGIGLLAALITTGVMKGKLKTVHAQAAAAQYVQPGSLNITEARDMFLFRQVHRQKRETQKSGGSSTHMSSSGRSHGGSKGSF
ncbi:MAG: TPM domain-containing protein [Oscillospiraceae bacterium]|nr:TPM domain-containing protein [Oscillospiraceae bacterium]